MVSLLLSILCIIKQDFLVECCQLKKNVNATNFLSKLSTLLVTLKKQIMSVKKIKELRHAGKLDEALQMAHQVLETEPDNIWNKRAAAWVYYDFLKNNSEPNSFEVFKDNLIKIKDLQLPEDDKFMFDKCAWRIGSLVFRLQNADNVDYGKINMLFEIIKDFNFSKPSNAYSFIYKAFHKGYQNWSKYLDFADWWNFDNLHLDDYLKEEFNGKKIMSIAEQAYIAYSKKLLEGEMTDSFRHQRVIDNIRIQSFLPKLDSLIERHPEYQYPLYFKVKLLLVLENYNNVLTTFLPFAKQKKNDFWVWKLLAEIFSNDKDIQFACYCKALSLKTSDVYLVKLKQNFAEILIEKGMYSEAKTEIEKVIAIRESQQWRLPNQIEQWKDTEWYRSISSNNNNLHLYSSYIKQAEEILFQDIQEEIIAVEFVNETCGILNFVKDKQKFGYFNYSKNLTTPKIGDLLKVRFDGEGKDGFYRIMTAKKAEANATSNAIKDFEGTIRIIYPQEFGFIEDIFVDNKIIAQYKLVERQFVMGRAILSFNKKKKEWGWKVIEIKR